MRIIAGRSKSGKSTTIYDEIAKEQRTYPDSSCILIVPDTITFQAENDMIARLENDGILDISILSITGLVNKILEEQGKGFIKELSTFGRQLILRKIVKNNGDKLIFYNKVKETKGMLLELESVIKEFKKSRINPEDLENVIRSSKRTVTGKKLKDIYLVYHEYLNITKNIYYDNEDKLYFGVNLIKTSRWVNNSKIWVDGFDHFDNHELILLKALEDYSRGLAVSLNIEPSYLVNLEEKGDWEAFKVVYDTYSSLGVISIDEKIIKSEFNLGIEDEIRVLEENLFSINPITYSNEVENIRAYGALNPYEEVEKTARIIRRLIRTKGYRYKDFKVAVSDKGIYENELKKIFNREDIPYYLDENKDILSSSLVKHIISLLDMFSGNFKSEDVIKHLKSGYSKLSQDQINKLENTALQFGLKGDNWFKEIITEVDEEVLLAQRNFIETFSSGREEFKSLITVGDYSSFILKYLDALEVKEVIIKNYDVLIQENSYAKASELSQSWNSIMEVLEQLLLISKDEIVDASSFKILLETGLREIKIRTIPPTIDTIEVGDIRNISVKGTKVLLIMGLTQDAVSDNREKGLLTDDDRREIIDCGYHIQNGTEFNTFRDYHILYRLFSAPSDMIFVSYPLSSKDDSSLQPALLLNNLRSIYPRAFDDKSLDDGLSSIESINHSWEQMVIALRNYLGSDNIDPVFRELFRWFSENREEEVSNLMKSLEFSNKVEGLDSQTIFSRFDNNLNMTVTKLEKYSECPFKYFVEDILRPMERIIQKVEFYDIGNEHHDVLEDFINRIMEKESEIPSMTREDARGMMAQSIQEVRGRDNLRNLTFEATRRNKYIQRKMERVLISAAEVILFQIQSGKFRPRFTELQIGMGSVDTLKIKPYIITLDKGVIKLRGKIDRVDTYKSVDGEEYVRIIDYKSSKKKIELKDLYEGLQLQLFVYLLAIVNNGESVLGKKPKVAGLYYFAVDDPVFLGDVEDSYLAKLKDLRLTGYTVNDVDIIRALDNDYENNNILGIRFTKAGSPYTGDPVLDADQFNIILEFVEGKIKEIANRIIEGEFPILPYKKNRNDDACKYCDYGSICMFDTTNEDSYRNIKGVSNKPLDFIELIKGKGGISHNELD